MMGSLSHSSIAGVLLLWLGSTYGQYSSSTSSSSSVNSQYNGGNQMQVNSNGADMMNLFMSNPNITNCFAEEPAITKIMMSANPATAFFDAMYNYCDETQEAKFKDALKNYEKCSGTDMNKFIETLAGSLVGVVMHCAQYFSDLGTKVQQAQLMGGAPTIPFSRIPDQCVQAFVGDNPFGNMVRFYQEYPEEDVHCFEQLYKDMPSCTLDEWPIPLVGSIFRPIACVYGNSLPMLEQSCRDELTALKGCLNVVSDITSETCNTVILQCTKEINSYTYDPSKLAWHMLLPRPLLGVPMSDACVRMAAVDAKNGNTFGFQNAVDKYNDFRSNCVSEDDLAIWDVQSSKELPAGDTVFSAAKKATPSRTVKPKKSGGFGTFVMGMLIGATLLVVGLIAYGRKYTNGAGAQIGPMRFGAPYNMLELTDNSEISFS